jgi:hypothetical protein
MAPAHVGAVCRRVFLLQLRVAQQTGARVAAFEEIVAEDAVVGEAIRERALEGIDVVDPLADEGAFARHVLVYVGHRARIGIDAGLPAVQARVPRALRAREAHAHARLEDGVSARHAFAEARAHRGIEARAVQGMRHGGPRAAARYRAGAACRCRA